MAQIHVDSQKLRDFARDLKNFSQTVGDHMGGLQSHLGRLGETWRDEEYERFVHEFATAQHRLRKFVEETDRVTPLLERDADSIDEFLRFRS